ncbi:MAG: acyltransferase family protein [Cyclobacteriaceae bacterium]|jgi:glucan biosynthesis protein C
MQSPTTTRSHDLDWLRFIAILILLFYHTGMWFNTWGWHVKNNETTVSFQYWMIWSHYFRMPLLLFISGAGTYMALGKRTPAQFAGERFRRLFIPLVFGMLVIVPPQIYYERIHQFASYWEFYKTVFQFKPYPEGGSLSWHHLWFILYLFIFSLLALPLLKYLRSERSNSFREKCAWLLSPPAATLFMPALLLLNSQFLLRPFFPEETHDLVHDWAYFVFYFGFFLAGMIAYAIPSLWKSLGLHRKYFLVAMLLALVPFYICYFHFRGLIQLPWEAEVIGDFFDRVSIFVSWFTVITIIAWGQHYLNRPHPWLSRINEGLYPFYILHQTVIIAIGYYICQLPWSISVKYWTIAFLTLAFCVVFYLALIRPFNVIRFLFGVKPREHR